MPEVPRPGTDRQGGPIDRASPDDLLELAADRGAVPWQIGALLVLDRPVDPERLRDALAARVAAVPRLRRRLVRTPALCGRPVWVDDPGFTVDRHVRTARCAERSDPSDVSALLDLAMAAVGTRLGMAHPPWAVTAVLAPDGRCVAVVVVLHHVLTDGAGGIEALARLLDGAPPPAARPFPLPAPSRRALLLDALAERRRLLTGPWTTARRLREAVGELRATRAPRPPRTSLNVPTGPRRALRVVPVDLAAARAAAHAHGGTVNDLLLTAVGGALGRLLERRGDDADLVVASVSVSARRDGDAGRAGNAVGVLPVALPTRGPAAARFAAVAARTARRHGTTRGASAHLLDGLFRLAAATGAFGWIVDHQRLVTTFVTNLHGPQRPVRLLGSTVRQVVPLTTTTGNVPVTFGALSYAGVLTLTVVADPDACPELDTVAADLRVEVEALLGPPGPLADRDADVLPPAVRPRTTSGTSGTSGPGG